MVDRDDGQARVTFARVDVDGRFVKGGVDVVDGERVVGVGSVARYVDDDAETTRGTSGLDRRLVEERRDFRGEVDAVDKNLFDEE